MLLESLVGLNIMFEQTELNVDFPQVHECTDSYKQNKELYNFEYIKELQEEIERQEEEQRRREEEERLEAIRIAEEMARQQEEQRIASVTFDPSDVTKPSNLTGDEMYNLLKDTGLRDVAYTYTQAEQQFGVNAFLLVGISALESSWGTSNRAVNDNNLTGYNIKSNDDYYAFSSRSESLMSTARLLSYNYLNEDGKYYSGKSVQSIHKNYCPPSTDACSGWSDKVTEIAIDLLKRYKNDN